MSNKEILDLNIMGKNISIACPPKDKEGLIQAAEILNNQIDSIPDKSNALIKRFNISNRAINKVTPQ